MLGDLGSVATVNSAHVEMKSRKGEPRARVYLKWDQGQERRNDMIRPMFLEYRWLLCGRWTWGQGELIEHLGGSL